MVFGSILGPKINQNWLTNRCWNQNNKLTKTLQKHIYILMIFTLPTPSNWWKNRPKNQLKKWPKFEDISDQFFVHLGSQNGPKNGTKLIKKSNKKSTKFWKGFFPIFPPFLPPAWGTQGGPKPSLLSSQTLLEPSWANLGQLGANLGSTWGQFGVNLGLIWGQLGANLGPT